MYETIIIGGGPAGISAGIYLARYNRSVLIIDKNQGRWNSNEINQNYFGFPHGIFTKKLRELGKQQAENFGAKFIFDDITDVLKNNEIFILKGNNSEYKAKSLIFATGVKDVFPEFENIDQCIGKSMFWCLTCDGYKAMNKNVVIIGSDNESFTTSLQFLNFTKKISVITSCTKDDIKIKKEVLDNLERNNIKLYIECIKNIVSKDGLIEYIELESGQKVECDFVFNHKEAKPNSELAERIGVKINDLGYILADNEQRTNIPFVYAAGDITKNFAHQVVTAAHEGSAAAEAANWDLYRPEQRGELTY